MESLIKAGTLDSLNSRGTLLGNVGRLLSLAQREQHLRETGQSTMFDLLGEEMPVPMPELDMVPSEISDKEKATWEKELMGVSFSARPFSPVASVAGTETTFCGHVEAELAGQSIVVAGRVISARSLFTKDGRPFASVILEDLSGQVEVMVWPKVYADTTDLWQESNELVVEGKVRVRDDRVQLNCDHVRHYQPVQAEEVLVPEPAETPEVIEAAAETAPAPNRQLVISLSQSSDEDRDTAFLHELMAILNDFPGQDEVKLSVFNDDRVTAMKLPCNTNYCPELQQRLAELVGEAGIKLEQIDSN